MDNLFYELFLDIIINLPVEKRIEAILILIRKENGFQEYTSKIGCVLLIMITILLPSCEKLSLGKWNSFLLNFLSLDRVLNYTVIILQKQLFEYVGIWTEIELSNHCEPF